jgi:hypothetical protein
MVVDGIWNRDLLVPLQGTNHFWRCTQGCVALLLTLGFLIAAPLGL